MLHDSRIQGSCRLDSFHQLQLTLSTCLDAVCEWMRANRLQLNTAKTEILWCVTSRRQHQIPTTAVRVGASTVAPTTSVRNLGIYIDSDLHEDPGYMDGCRLLCRSGVSVTGCVIGTDKARLRQRDAYWPASLSVLQAAVGT